MWVFFADKFIQFSGAYNNNHILSQILLSSVQGRSHSSKESGSGTLSLKY